MFHTTSNQTGHTFYLGRFLLGITVVLCLFCVVGMREISQHGNVFTEFLVGDIAMDGSNKTGEWHLFWGMLLAGCLMMSVLCIWEEFYIAPKKVQMATIKWNIDSKYVMGMSVFFPVLARAFIYHKLSIKLLLVSFIFSFIVVFFQDAKEWICLLACIYFSLWSVAVTLGVFFQNYFLGDTKILLSALFVFALLVVLSKGKKENMHSKSVFLLSQPLLPLLCLVYLKQDYLYQNRIMHVSFSKTYLCLILGIIVCLYISIAIQYIRKKQFFFAAPISVYLFVSYMPTGLILPSDLHHHGEQMIGWQQISEFGQTLYKQYSPASGLFSLMTGFVDDAFFHYTATEYGMSFVLCGMFFAVITMYLLYRRLQEWAIFVAILVPMPEYCRVWILLPVLLILTEPKLVEKKQIWLIVWIACILLAGLYYPLFGVALLLATLPSGIVFLIKAVKEPVSKKVIIAGAILCGIILLLSPLLLRMLSHVLSMAGQTISVDGKAILGMQVPEWFMPKLMQGSIKKQIYYLMRFVMGIVFVLEAVYFALKYAIFPSIKEMKRDNTKLAVANIYKLNYGADKVALIAVPIVLIVCYSYTMVCMDEDWVGNLLSRSCHVIMPVCVSFGLVILNMIKENLSNQIKSLLTGILCAVPFLFLISCEDFAFPYLDGRSDGKSDFVLEYASKIQPYDGLDGYVYIEDEIKQQYPYIDFEVVGNGFVPENVLQNLNKNAFVCNVLKQVDPQMRLLGFEHTQFYYYLLGEPCVYSGRTAIAKSAKSFEKLKENLDPAHTIIRGGINALDEYQLYLWCVKNGYVYEPNLNVYMPINTYQKLNGGKGSVFYSPWCESCEIGKIAGSFGESLDSLKLVESGANISYTKLENEIATWLMQIDALDSDCNEFLYVELEDVDQKIIASEEAVTLQIFTGLDEIPVVEMKCDLANGKLFIPIGSNPACFLGNINKIILSVDTKQSLMLQKCLLFHGDGGEK